LEPTNPPPPRSHTVQSVLNLSLGVALAALMTTKTRLASPPVTSRRFPLRQFSLPSWVVAPPVRFRRAPKRSELPILPVVGTPDDLNIVLDMIADASRWLKTRGTDQWAKPWPDREQRDERVRRGLANKKTFILRDGDTPAATVTVANWHNPEVWVSGHCTCDLTERAVYLHRLITARKYAGRRLGEKLIDWAAERARARYGAKWVRIDVWTTNTELHRYYESLGFERCGTCPIPGYPSRALFQKAIAEPRKEQPLPR
jgi:GNAT superfamily N-acetyltransferase